MPGLVKGGDLADSTSAFFKNKNEICERTNTNRADWDPMVKDIREWWEALPPDEQEFQTTKGKDAKAAFSKVLATQLTTDYPERVADWKEDTIINLADALIGYEKKQIVKRLRKKTEPTDANTMSQDDDQPYTRPQSVASTPTKRSAPEAAAIFEDEDVRISYGGAIYSISLSDIGRACTPPLDAKDVSKHIGLAAFMAPFCEEIDLSSANVSLYYRYSMATTATLLKTDRSLRPALRDYLKDPTGLYFQIEVKDASGPQTIPTTRTSGAGKS